MATTGKQILMVEDDVFLRDMYEHVFSQAGFQVTQATDGQDGVNKAEAGQFDLILLDIMLPLKSGIEVLRELRQPGARTEKTPVILLSNLGQGSVIEEAYKIGADGYLLKADLLPRQVLEKVQDFLAGKLTKEDFLKSKSLD